MEGNQWVAIPQSTTPINQFLPDTHDLLEYWVKKHSEVSPELLQKWVWPVKLYLPPKLEGWSLWSEFQGCILINRLNVLMKQHAGPLQPFLPCKKTYLWSREKILIRPRMWWHLDHQIPSLYNCEQWIILFICPESKIFWYSNANCVESVNHN